MIYFEKHSQHVIPSPGTKILLFVPPTQPIVSCMLNELLLTIGGLCANGSNLEELQFNHPSEREIFEKANVFGAKFVTLQELCFKSTGPITSVLQNDFVQKFLDYLVKVENRVFTGDILSLSHLMSETVLVWERTLDYTLELAKYQNTQGPHFLEKLDLIPKLHNDSLSGFPQIKEISINCLAALERAWMQQLRPWILWGKNQTVTLDHPSFPEKAELLKELGTCLQNIDPHSIPEVFIEVAEDNSRLIDSLRYPLQEEQFNDVLTTMRDNIFHKILPRFLEEAMLDDFLFTLRNIVLCGSSAFTTSFSRSQHLDFTQPRSYDLEIMKNALSYYYEDGEEISKSCYDFANRVLILRSGGLQDDNEDHNFEDILYGVNVYLELCIDWRFALFMSSTHCDVYGDLFTYLICVRTVSDLLQAGTPVGFKYKLFLNMLWEWFQCSIDNAFESIKGVFLDRTMTVTKHLEIHTKTLKSLGHLLLFNSRPLRQAVKRILVTVIDLHNGHEVSDRPILDLISLAAEKPGLDALQSHFLEFV